MLLVAQEELYDCESWQGKSLSSEIMYWCFIWTINFRNETKIQFLSFPFPSSVSGSISNFFYEARFRFGLVPGLWMHMHQFELEFSALFIVSRLDNIRGPLIEAIKKHKIEIENRFKKQRLSWIWFYPYVQPLYPQMLQVW